MYNGHAVAPLISNTKIPKSDAKSQDIYRVDPYQAHLCVEAVAVVVFETGCGSVLSRVGRRHRQTGVSIRTYVHNCKLIETQLSFTSYSLRTLPHLRRMD